MFMKPRFYYNQKGVKDSLYQYRNINGIHYKCWTSDTTIFEEEKRKAKEKGLKYRIIKDELYIEVKDVRTLYGFRPDNLRL